jgi:hypothetical protein
MVPGGDQHQRGGVRADAVQAQQARRAGGDQRDDQLIQALHLRVQELGAAAQLAQRNPQIVQLRASWLRQIDSYTQEGH